MKKIICILFHQIVTIKKSYFLDPIESKYVGLFYCKNCNRKFLANKKKSYFRVYQ